MRRYNITDLTKELGVTRQTIYYWIKKGWIMPKRDYRNYPVFTDEDLRRIKKWQQTLKKEAVSVKQRHKRKLPTDASPIAAPCTWEEIQKTLYKS